MFKQKAPKRNPPEIASFSWKVDVVHWWKTVFDKSTNATCSWIVENLLWFTFLDHLWASFDLCPCLRTLESQIGKNGGGKLSGKVVVFFVGFYRSIARFFTIIFFVDVCEFFFCFFCFHSIRKDANKRSLKGQLHTIHNKQIIRKYIHVYRIKCL